MTLMAFVNGLANGLTIEVAMVGIPFSTSFQTGSFEVFITGDLAGEPPVAAHQLRVSLAVPPTEIVFDSAGVTIDRTYLGPSSAPVVSARPWGHSAFDSDADAFASSRCAGWCYVAERNREEMCVPNSPPTSPQAIRHGIH